MQTWAVGDLDVTTDPQRVHRRGPVLEHDKRRVLAAAGGDGWVGGPVVRPSHRRGDTVEDAGRAAETALAVDGVVDVELAVRSRDDRSVPGVAWVADVVCNW
jgi:hypothetical protein